MEIALENIRKWIDAGDVTEPLDLFGLGLTELPELPKRLQLLYCGRNQLTSLPELLTTLQELDCYHNQLTALPTLPTTLQILNCCNNQLTALPELPTTLQELYFGFNQLTYLPELPSRLQVLYCNSNQLTYLPELPLSLQELHCNDNCFPNRMDGESIVAYKKRLLPHFLPFRIQALKESAWRRRSAALMAWAITGLESGYLVA